MLSAPLQTVIDQIGHALKNPAPELHLKSKSQYGLNLIDFMDLKINKFTIETKKKHS